MVTQKGHFHLSSKAIFCFHSEIYLENLATFSANVIQNYNQ